jgi:chromosome segregation ATPase
VAIWKKSRAVFRELLGKRLFSWKWYDIILKKLRCSNLKEGLSMVPVQSFRTAFHGFNREDVVSYIEYLNNKHNTQVNQLNTEIQTLRAELDAVPAPVENTELEEKCAALEQELMEVKQQLEAALANQTTVADCKAEELEAYRRAERVERQARDRVERLYSQVNGVLADATVKVDEAAAQVSAIAGQVTAQIGALQSAVCSSKDALQDAAATMYAIRPGAKED